MPGELLQGHHPGGPGDLFQTTQPHLKTTHWNALVVMKSLEILSTLSGPSGSDFPFPAFPPPEVTGISRLPPVWQQHTSDTMWSNTKGERGELERYLLQAYLNKIPILWVPIWHCHHLPLKDCGNAGIQIHKHLKNWLKVIFKLWPYPSVCKSSLQHLPEDSAGDFGRRGTREWSRCSWAMHPMELWSSSHPKHPTGTWVHLPAQGQPRDMEIQDSLRCSQGARSRNGLGRSAGPMDPWRGRSCTRTFSFMGTTRNKGTS